jgi:hypothetical protein
MVRTLMADQRRNVELAAERDAARMSAAAVASDRTQPERSPPHGHESDVARVVHVGAYVNRIVELSVVESSWKADFYVWFRWDGDGLDPGETLKAATGEIESRTLLKRSDDGKSHYTLYRVVAQITKKFDVARFPRDVDLLLITLEDQALQSYQMVYDVDPSESDLSSRAELQGYALGPLKVAVKPHSYKSAMGDPGLPRAYKATYSQFVIGVPMHRTTWGLFWKMFLALYISMGIAVGGLVLLSPSERLAMGGTAMFVAIMNAESIATLVPDTGTSTLGDVINGMGFAGIGVCLLQGIIYHRWLHGDGRRTDVARAFDGVTLLLVPTLYVLANVGVLLAAQ